ncbi:MAG: PAS domain-containing protein [Ferruginibacter sp.]
MNELPLCWDIASMGLYNLLNNEKNIDLHQLKKLAHINNWENNLHDLIIANEYEALIVTNTNQNILWTNNGFSNMTGYKASFAKNKKPGFLQGAATCARTKKRIKEQLIEKKMVRETIINYRKSGEAYNCDIWILPLLNTQQVLTHFIALEKSIA